jgi:2-oxoglutarate dehydrogenase E2 component (dihydrolipoamide succinyltransferase)
MSDVTMPQLGETVTEGTITKWFKQIGAEVKADEPLFEVSTDKVDTEVPSPVAGVLQEIKAQEGDTVEVGAIIAVVGAGDSAPSAPSAPSASGSTGPVVGEAQAGSAPASPPSTSPAPPLEPPAEPPMAEPPAAAPPPPPPPPSPPAAEQSDAASASPAPAAPSSVLAPSGDNRLLSPVVRRLVNEHGLDPGQITGTGPGGRITRDDVVNHIEHGAPAAPPAPAAPAAPAAPPAPAAAPPASAPAPVASPPAPVASPPAPAPAAQAGARDEAIRLSKIRTLTGDHMRMSLATSPHAFSVVEVDYANVDRVRDAIKNEWKQAEGFSLTYLPFISRAVVDAIAEFPHMNASVGDGQLIVHRYVDLGIAVDLNYQGLIVPIVREADTKRLRAIAREISDLASRA